MPRGPLPDDAFGALVTPPLGWTWDGGDAEITPRPGALLWVPPRHPIDRFLARFARERDPRPRLVTLAADGPAAIAEAVELAETIPQVQGLILWWWSGSESLSAAVEAARRASLLPLLAEVPVDLAIDLAPALAEAGADALIVGPPRAAGEAGRATRLWGPAILPLVERALDRLVDLLPNLPLLAGAGIGTPDDAVRATEAGATAVALGPEWWTDPALAAEIVNALA